MSCLEQVRISLLPLSFVAGKRRNCYFSKFADESISSIFDLMKDKQMSPPCPIADDVFDNYRIRLTQYSERIDLSGCIQITPYFLFLSLVSSSCNMDPSSRRGVFERLIEFEHPKWNCYPVSKELLSTMSFESVQELDVSKNQWPRVDAVIKCINMSFPSLKLLKATHCLNFQMKTLCDVVQNCPQIIEIDLTVDISCVIPARVSVISASTEPYQGLENASYKMLKERMLSSNLTKLTLEGRTDINDIDLHIISGFSSSLSHLNLKGCSSVTDMGISQLVSNCMNLRSLLVSDTDFGRNSVLALSSDVPLPAHLLGLHHHHMHLSTLAFQLQQLHICGCKSVTPASLSHLMSHTYSLRSLSLRETSLLDDALYAFMGSSLEYVDVSETMVSGTALAYFIHRNPRLTVLKAMGCSNLHGYKNNAEINKCPSKILPISNRSDEEDLFHELSQTCILKEMEFGWGFTPFSLEILRPSVRTLRVVTFGLGASLGEHALTILPDICPLLEEVVLKFQVISDCILRSIMSSLRNLKVLSLCYCLGILTSLSFQIRMPNLTTLRLERVTPGMTNDDLIILTRGCSSLHELSLIGCMLLNSDSQHIISSGWPGLRSIHLEGCGKVTCNGVSSLFECKALEDLLLRHNGRGIQRNLIEDAASKLPLLRTVSLDLCDASEGGFDTPSSANRFFLSSVKIACCKTQRCAFTLQNSTACKMVHKETIVLEWSSKEVRTTIVRERV